MLPRFLSALHSRRQVRVSIAVPEEGKQITLTCAPLDYGELDRDDGPSFLFFDLVAHETFGALPDWILDLEVLDDEFIPADVIDWDVVESPWKTAREW
jgi:hypothetical protein